MIYRYLCAGNLPDHTSIARFRQDTVDVIEGLFTQVLVLCAGLGMVRLGVVGLDGTKIASDASMGVNRTEKGLLRALEREAARQAAKAAAEHARTDKNEDALFGPDGRGDVVPDDPGTRSGRAERLRQALDKVRQLQREQDEQAKPTGPTNLKGNGRTTAEQVALAQAKLDKVRAEQQAKIDRWEAGNKKGHRPKPVDQAHWVKHAAGVLARVVERLTAPPRRTDRNGTPLRPPVCNTTDPDSRLQPKRDGGWLQGFNCQALTSRDGIIIGTSVSPNPVDTPTFPSMIAAGMKTAQLLAEHRPDTCNNDDTTIGLVLADAGYLSNANLTSQGPDRLIAVGKRQQLEHDARHNPTQGPPPEDADPITTMAHRLRTPEGITAYRQRAHIAETPFGNTKHNRNFRRTTGRGLTRAKADWTFNALVHNLSKAHRHTTTT